MSTSAHQSPAREPLPADDIGELVLRCRTDRRFLAELRRLYEDVDRRQSATGANCLGGGGCCKFDVAGHRLYLTAGELAFLTQAPPPRERQAAPTSITSAPEHACDSRKPELRCPYQRRGRCAAHDRRPLGCRAYFCRAAAHGPGPAIYEEFHRKLAALHERFGLPYLYAELTGALAQILP